MAASLSGVAGREDRLGEILAALIEAEEHGQAPDRAAWLARHPEFTAELNEFFDSEDRLHSVAAPLRAALGSDTPRPPATAPGSADAVPAQAGQCIGDYELLEEIARGGMGVVWKARQQGANRIVALKLLRSDPLGGAEQARRFRNEAEIVAQLDHPHIVPLYEVDEHAGRVYFSMKFLEGGSLADLLPRYAAEPRAAAQMVAAVARAVHHAHQRGVLHRDLKPSNILLDADGRPHVTDFGLARRLEVDSSLTQSGAVVGTPSYMAPEQASGHRGDVTTATDVYGLGAVLYALLTGRPPFQADALLDVLVQVREQEPRPPSAGNRRVDRDLETICLKCLAKDPASRYGSAAALADDLERFLKDEPVQARRPSLLQRGRKWARRHKAVVWSAAVLILLAALLGAGNALWWVQKRARAEGEAQAAVHEAVRLKQEEKWAEALSAVRRAEGVLAGFRADLGLWQQVAQLGKDLEMARRLEAARLLGTAGNDGHFDHEAADAAYADAFQWYGLDVDSLDPREAGARVQSCSIRMQLTAALDDWAWMQRALRGSGWKQRVAIARVADPDPWRSRLRDTLERKDAKALEELATSARSDEMPPGTAVLLARVASGTAAAERALVVLRQVQQHYPADFCVNHHLGISLRTARPPHLEEALRYQAIAVALRPQSHITHLNLGTLLHIQGKVDEAMAEFREALRLEQDFAGAHNNLGIALRDKGQLDEAIVEFREALRLKQDYAEAHNGLGTTLWYKGQLDEAIAEFREALRLRKYAAAHNNLGAVLAQKGLLEEAMGEFREALRLDKDNAEARNNLGAALLRKGLPEEAMGEFREAVRLKKDFAPAHNNLGTALNDTGQLDEAIAEYSEALRLKKDYAMAHNNLALTLKLVQLRDRLPAVLQGKDQPKDARERLAFANLCQQPNRQQYAAAVRFYEEAFAADPKLADDRSGHRYNAACAAALAGYGQGKDADQSDEMARTRLRRQALEWLHADLVAYRRLLEKDPDEARDAVLKKMQHWLQDPDFGCVRGPEALSRLPPEERAAWAALWASVAELLARARELTPPNKPPQSQTAP
jgi:serine/threonine-protein kinase